MRDEGEGHGLYTHPFQPQSPTPPHTATIGPSKTGAMNANPRAKHPTRVVPRICLALYRSHVIITPKIQPRQSNLFREQRREIFQKEYGLRLEKGGSTVAATYIIQASNGYSESFVRRSSIDPPTPLLSLLLSKSRRLGIKTLPAKCLTLYG